LRAVTKYRRWNNDHKVYAHVYYNARKAQGTREDLYAEQQEPAAGAVQTGGGRMTLFAKCKIISGKWGKSGKKRKIPKGSSLSHTKSVE
jgi:hypothetical protein